MSAVRPAVVVADPSPFNRRFVRAAVDRCSKGMAVVSEVATMVELLDCIVLVRPDVIVIEPSIDEVSGIGVVPTLMASGAIPVIFAVRQHHLDVARAHGFIAAAKFGLVRPTALEAAIREALDRLHPIATIVSPVVVTDELLRSVLDEWSDRPAGTTEGGSPFR